MTAAVPILDPGVGREALERLAGFVPENFDASDALRDWGAEAEFVRAEMVRRGRLLEACEDPDMRAAAYLRAKRDPINFINDWCFTYDPRAREPLPKTIPFVLWERQEELVEYLVALYSASTSGAVKKSRDVGASWTAIAVIVWLFVFYPETLIGLGSNLERNVDRLGDPKSLFWKVRFLLHRLPAWMRPEGWRLGGDSDNNLRILNPQNGSVIIGEGGRGMGRSGRYSVYVLDEWAWVTYAEELWGGLVDTTDTLIPISTSRGAGTHFWSLEQAKTIAFFYFNWRDDPRKDEVWAEAKKKMLGATRWAIEHEGDDYAATEHQIIPAEWVLSSIAFERGEYPAGIPRSKQAGLDVADGGGDETVLAKREGIDVWVDWSSATRIETETYETIGGLLGADDWRFVVDKVGVGAGVPAGVEPHAAGSLTIERVANNMNVPEHWRFPDDPEGETPETRFKDYASAAWWWMRLRFEMTHRFLNGERDVDVDLLISIRDDPQLISQLTSRKYVEMGERIRLESKKEMRSRGLSSPDRAEAVVYACAPPLASKRRKALGGSESIINRELRSGKIAKGGW